MADRPSDRPVTRTSNHDTAKPRPWHVRFAPRPAFAHRPHRRETPPRAGKVIAPSISDRFKFASPSVMAGSRTANVERLRSPRAVIPRTDSEPKRGRPVPVSILEGRNRLSLEIRRSFRSLLSYTRTQSAAAGLSRPATPLIEWRLPSLAAAGPVTTGLMPRGHGEDSRPGTKSSKMRAQAARKGAAGATEAPPVLASARQVMPSPSASMAMALDSAAIDRLAEDVMRRIERRSRIERERRGL